MIQPNTARGKNKAADLKKLIQQACNSQKAQTIETIAPLSARLKDPPFESSKPKANLKATEIIHKNTTSKDISSISNSRKGLSTISNKSKENVCINKKSPRPNSKLGSSTSLKSKLCQNLAKSMKQIKISPICTSIQLPKSIKTISSTATSRDKRGFKFERSYDSVKESIHSNNRLEVISPRKPKGLKITNFNLGRKLGKGRFGSVRLAQDKATKFILAIKTINIEQLRESQMESQLIEQVKLQMFCNHPNILKMYGCFCDDQNIYLLLELGTSCLFQELRTDKYFSQQKTAYYIKQMIESLKYVHSESIIHRDIKPQNILVTNGVLKLSDFGWSTYSPVLKRQTFCGTLDYVSPQVVNGDYYDQKVDIWSLGVLIYELAVGKAPFEDPNNNQEATYDKIMAADIQFPSRTSTQFQDLVSRILLKNPNQRLMMQQIQTHPWLQKYKTTGRFISKQIWDVWQGIRNSN